MKSRRSILIGGGLVAAAAVLAGTRLYPRRREGMLIGFRRVLDVASEKQIFSCLVTSAAGEVVRTIPMTFFGHGFAADPVMPRRAVIFEKKGPGACEVDLIDGKVTRPIKTSADRYFYGHGAYSPDSRTLFATETVLEGKTGLVSIRDARTHDVLGEFPSYGKEPHDCTLVDGGKTLAITNGGGALGDPSAPSVTYVDIATNKLLEELVFENERINAGHLLITADRFLVVVSAPRTGLSNTDPGGITIRSVGDVFDTMDAPADVVAAMTGETLSLAVHEPSGVVAATNPEGGIVTFWNIRERTFVRKLALRGARAIALTKDGLHFAVSWGPEGDLAYVSTATLRIDETLARRAVGIGGSHLFNWNHDALLG